MTIPDQFNNVGMFSHASLPKKYKINFLEIFFISISKGTFVEVGTWFVKGVTFL